MTKAYRNRQMERKWNALKAEDKSWRALQMLQDACFDARAIMDAKRGESFEKDSSTT
ncbi:MAG TPA: hypothetical protein VHA52_09850 [Candidatus Babeliaceae bacterium]|nr:hypothetical protein [Candidatus Babeliaceae bacterium]